MKTFIRKVKKDRLGEYAAESSYYIILSIIPFLLVFISLIQYINIDKITLIYYAKQIIPKTFQDFSLNIIEEIFSKTIATLSFSFIFAIWSASKGFFSIMKGIGHIYNIEKESYLKHKLRSIIFTISFIFLILLTLIILILGEYLGIFFENVFKNTLIEEIIRGIIKFDDIIFFTTIFFNFLFFYKFILDKDLKIINQTMGALFATIIWYMLSYGFSLYIDLNKGFSRVYGSLSVIILFMLWTYCIIYAILLGAEINFYHKNRQN